MDDGGKQVLTTWMPQDEEGAAASWKSRRSTQVAASVLLLVDSHPLVLQNMVRTPLPGHILKCLSHTLAVKRFQRSTNIQCEVSIIGAKCSL